jgi:methylmalonyl-CoA/ethylmalonyl-CoA epimerase
VSDATSFGPSRIGQIAINVKDLNRAVAFYRDVLRLTFLFEAPPSLAFFDCGGVRVMLSPPEAPEHDHPGSVIYYVVDDLEAAYAGVVERGAESFEGPHLIAKMPDHDLWMAFVKDTEGNLLGLMSEVRPPGGAR